MNTREAQNLIRTLSDKLGWSQAKLAKELYVELYDEDDDAEITRFTEKLKKQLVRSSTPVDRLKTYINIIRRHPDLEKIDLVAGHHVPTPGLLPKNLEKGLMDISKKLTQRLKLLDGEGIEE